VCDGVQHAHQKAIIHRDLKPSNVLVAVQDGKPAPKIIDFGIAKAMGQQLTEQTMFTQIGVLVGTPEYMSPEQTDLTGQHVDTRTDVYALGLILYELLVGAPPFATQLRSAGIDEMLRTIREEEPPRPSAKLRTLGDASTTARNRRTEPHLLTRQLQGDLDRIVIKTLDKDPARRYGSPSELAADIARYLADEPVLATPPSVVYRIRKFSRRHRSGVAIAAGVLLLLGAAAVTTTLQSRRIAREGDRANREAEVSQQTTEFLTGLFRVVDPGEARGNAITAREILDRGAARIDTELGAQPEIQARMKRTMGVVYTNLGLYKQAQALLEPAVDIERRLRGPDHVDTLAALNALGGVYRRLGRTRDAEDLFRDTLTVSRRTLGPDHRQTAATMTLLADALMRQRRYAEAETLYRDALPVSSRLLGPEHLETLTNKVGLGWVHMMQKRYSDAEAEMRDALVTARRVFGPDDPFTFSVTGILSENLLAAHRYADAEALLRELVAGRTRVLGPEHPMTLTARSTLGQCLLYEQRYPEAERVTRETFDIQHRVRGPDSVETLDTGNNLGWAYVKQGRYAEAEQLFQEMLEIKRRKWGPKDPFVTTSLYNLACVSARRGHRDEAVARLREALDQGFAHPEAIAEDEDLRSLHGDPRFEAIVAGVRAAGTLKP
jgi:tetratricopeptide (TPR) repeat protein